MSVPLGQGAVSPLTQLGIFPFSLVDCQNKGCRVGNGIRSIDEGLSRLGPLWNRGRLWHSVTCFGGMADSRLAAPLYTAGLVSLNGSSALVVAVKPNEPLGSI